MNDQRSPHNTGDNLVRREITHNCIVILRSEKGHTALLAGLVGRSGWSFSALKMGVSALMGRGSHLLLFPVFPACRGPPAFLVSPTKNQESRCLQMKNYWASDYALNRKSARIVYCFADGVVEVSLEDYLRENPDKTETDFLTLKAISDEIYREQERALNAKTYKDISLHICKGATVPSPEEAIEEAERLRDLEKLRSLLDGFLKSGILTEVQRRRFSLYCFQGLSTRQIARAEGVSQCAIWKSLVLCQKKFQIFLKKRVVTPPDFLR